MAQMEQEKFELQKKHTDNIQQLLEDTNQRLAKMEAEYGSQAHGTVSDFFQGRFIQYKHEFWSRFVSPPFFW